MAEDLESEINEEIKWYSSKLLWLLAGALLFFLLSMALLVFSNIQREKAAILARSLKPVEILEVSDPDNVLSGAIVRPDPFVINLKNNTGILNITLVIEFYDIVPVDFTDRTRAVVRDTVITEGSNYEARQLLDFVAKENFKRKIIASISEQLPEENPPVEVYFEEFNIQSPETIR